MAGLDYSNTILIVKPVGPAALEALRSEPNAGRLFSFQYPGFDSTISLPEQSGSRECTPFILPPPEIQLHLKFDPIPKNPQRGFVFGSKEKTCDILLLDKTSPGRASSGISGEHFCIEFNWNSGYTLVNNISRSGTRILIKDGVRSLESGIKRALFPEEQTRIQVGALEFDIIFPVRDQYQNVSYERNWEIFKARCLGSDPNVDGLNLETKRKITEFVAIVQGQKGERYKINDEIGAGDFGIVRKAVREGDATLFAAKVFSKQTAKPTMEIELMEQINHVRPDPDFYSRTYTDISLRNILSNTRMKSER